MKQRSVKPTWFIDLDNTLHNASHAVFPAMHEKMNAYMAALLGDGEQDADAATVNAARVLYWKKYGATLLGLIRHHQVNAHEFLQQTHQFEQLDELLRFETGLKKCLARLPGRKILLTNAPRQYAQQVLRHLGLQSFFNGFISIESMRVHGELRPKPSRWLLKKIVAQKKLSLQHCVLIEDARENLRSAKQLGMKTVWVTQYLPQSTKDSSVKQQRFSRNGFIDLKVRSVKQIPAHLSRLSLKK